jgi:hypothetical protein
MVTSTVARAWAAGILKKLRKGAVISVTAV